MTLNRFFDPAVATATVHPTMIGKINTALQILLLSATLGLPLVSEAYLDLARYAIEGLQWTVAATTITSAISYIKSYRTVVKFLKK